MIPRRVVITGIGAVTPVGSSADGLWRGIRRGISGVRPITRFDASPFRSRIAAEVHGFDALDYMDGRSARRMDRFAQFGIATAAQALADAAIDRWRIEPSRSGVSLGSALGGVAYGEDQHREFLGRGLRAVGPTLAIAVYGGASGANIAIHFDLRGPNLAHASSCASGAVAVGEAFRLIQRGDADLMLAGGVEVPLAPLTFGAFAVIKAMSTRNDDPAAASRPFDERRDGFVMAEGGAMVVLEELTGAERRGATIYAEISGYAQTNDAFHMTAPRPDGTEAGRAVTSALRDADLPPQSIGYVNAHATGTPLGDAAEGCALEAAFGRHLSHIPVSGTKGLYGHALGASGAIEVAITSLAIRHGWLPGTVNLSKSDMPCRMQLLPPEGLERQVDAAVTTAFGFGGVNSALVLTRYSG